MNKFSKLFLLLALLTVFLSATVSAVAPFGANVINLSNERAPEDTAGNATAIAGNVSELTITGFAITQSWQGYFGNVSGTIMLADNSDNVMYNWSLASPEGEVYACVNNSISWGNVACFTDVDLLEAEYGIASDDVDGINETFTQGGTHESGFGFTHNLFYTNNIEFSAGECLSSHIFAGNQNATDNTFQEVLLRDTNSDNSIIFTSILDEETPLGFDGRAHDFEMLVLEDGHLTDIDTTIYYFWVELE